MRGDGTASDWCNQSLASLITGRGQHADSHPAGREFFCFFFCFLNKKKEKGDGCLSILFLSQFPSFYYIERKILNLLEGKNKKKFVSCNRKSADVERKKRKKQLVDKILVWPTLTKMSQLNSTWLSGNFKKKRNKKTRVQKKRKCVLMLVIIIGKWTRWIH